MLRGREKLEAEGMFPLKSEPGPGMCCVKGCRKKHVPEYRGGKLHLCARHYQARWRKLNPKQAAYRALKDHAAARKIGFSLSFDAFLEMTDAAGYWTRSSENWGDVLSIDRIDPVQGYTENNVRVITLSENVAKGNRERFLPEHVQSILARKRAATPWQMDEGKHWLDD